MFLIIYRILATNMESFSAEPDVVWHIPHRYSREMSEKSTVVSYVIVFFVSVTLLATQKSTSFYLKVPLRVVRKNENKLDEMCQIMDELNKYVPINPITMTIPLPSGESMEHTDTIQHELLFGGDQLTASRQLQRTGMPEWLY